MIKVLLVDDEAIEREGLRLILERNRTDIEVAGEAQNGEKAIELAKLHQPDIIFMDIKMPVIDGLEAVKEISTQLPEAKCIMVSAYDTFQYAQEAMKYGVKEYLLKPSKVKEVLEAFDRMAEEVRKEKTQRLENKVILGKLEQASTLMEMEFIVSLMLDHVHDVSDWKQWLDIEDAKGFVSVFSFSSDYLNPDHNRKSEWYKLLKQSLEEQTLKCFVGPLTSFQVPVFVKLDDEEAIDIREEFTKSVIHSSSHLLEDCNVNAGVGTVVESVQQFSKSYEEAIYALALLQNHANARYLIYSEKLEARRKEFVPYELEKEVLEAVQKGDQQTSLSAFDQYFQWIQQQADYSVKNVQKAIENFFIILTRTTQELGLEQDFAISFHQYETNMQIKEIAKAHLLSVIEQIADWRTNGVEGLLIQAKEYVNQHFQKAITLDEVAAHVNLSSYYLSKLFKEYFDVTFVEYVTELRIQKAKTYLLDGVTPLKEIALNIGYRDPNYFSRVFKKEVGMSPSDFRHKYQ
ncbi:response regulator [Gracilibacillus oryzae]|uniref:Response regulator n=1 Tax=Gracilibacillus oryzae TaxID=1672701 RepID=A0A7C8KUT7_9BACI|nr:response regulator [Gracilibacillus oryzae]KAB8137726.1 response regulator [Gracilibacillus oryzae]